MHAIQSTSLIHFNKKGDYITFSLYSLVFLFEKLLPHLTTHYFIISNGPILLT